MLIKFTLVLFCCALINAKTLVRRESRHEIETFDREEIEHENLPFSFKTFHQDEDIEENSKFGTYPRVHAEQENIDEKEKTETDADSNSESEEAEDELKENETTQMKEVKIKEGKEETEEDEEEEKEEDEEEDETNNENDKEEDEEESKESEEDEGKNEENVDEKKEENTEEEDEVLDSSEEEEDKFEQSSNRKNFNQNPAFVQASGASIGSENEHPEMFKLPKQPFNVLSASSQNPTNNQLTNTISKVFDLKTLTENFSPLKKLWSENNLNEAEADSWNELSDDSLTQKIAELEGKSNIEDKIETNDQSPRIELDLDNLSVGSFISQAIPESFQNFETKFKTLQNMFLNNFHQRSKPSKAGFGGWRALQKTVYGNLTAYVNNAVKHAQAQLEDNGRRVVANNPPLTINLIPGIPVTFKLKFLEGAHTLDAYGQSRGIRTNKLYVFSQCKFTELRYYYDVIIKPMNLFAVRKSITVILNDAPTRMSLTVENDKTMKILGLEFVNPEVTVDSKYNRIVDYGLNYIVNEVHPLIKQKLVEVVSRDSKMILADHLKNAQ